MTDASLIILTALVTGVLGIGASSGLWAYLQSRDKKKDATLQLLLGLAHDRIVHLGMSYVEKRSISKDEYDDYIRYLYEPYSAFGGNGLAERVMKEVSNLPIYKNSQATGLIPIQNVKEKQSD